MANIWRTCSIHGFDCNPGRPVRYYGNTLHKSAQRCKIHREPDTQRLASLRGTYQVFYRRHSHSGHTTKIHRLFSHRPSQLFSRPLDRLEHLRQPRRYRQILHPQRSAQRGVTHK